MKITAIETFLVRAGGPLSAGGSAEGVNGPSTASGLPLGGARHWCFVEIHTDEGLTGLGEASGWPKVAEVAISDLAPLLIGEDPDDIERLWLKLRSAIHAHGSTGTVGGGALSGLEMALWDLKGKRLGVPIWSLLGGKVRSKIKCYAHAGTAAQAREFVNLGYLAIKTGGVANPIAKVEAIRTEVGDEIDLMVDLHGPPDLTTKDALILGRELEKYRLLFWEEPVTYENWEGLARLRDSVAIPLATGERIATVFEFHRLLSLGCVDVLQPDTGRCGGLLQMWKIAAMAEANFCTIAPHSGSLGPVAEYAAVHLLAAIPNALVLERFGRDWAGKEALINAPLRFVDGYLEVPTSPGLGVELLKPEVAKYPPGFNVGLRADDRAGTFDYGTACEHVAYQSRWRRSRYFASSR
jgi:galactonate dehydratase